MQMELPDRRINVVSIIYRDEWIQEYKQNDIAAFIAASEYYNFTGTLLFESNRGNVEPWTLGNYIMASTKRLIPFIAVNPVYMHPFMAAKKIMSLSKFYNRQVFINFITGTASSDLTNLNDNLGHDERYDRLVEYILIMDHLLKSKLPLTFEGKYYTVRNLVLSAQITPDFYPRYFIAGASPKAMDARAATKACRAYMGMDMTDFQTAELLPSQQYGVHFGIISSDDRIKAKAKLDTWLPDSNETHELFVSAMKNTDSTWKQALIARYTDPDALYSVKPLKHLKSDCPYYVGSYEEVAEAMVKYVLNGYDTLIVETPDFVNEFENIRKVFDITKERLLNTYYPEKKLAFDFNFNI